MIIVDTCGKPSVKRLRFTAVNWQRADAAFLVVDKVSAVAAPVRSFEVFRLNVYNGYVSTIERNNGQRTVKRGFAGNWTKRCYIDIGERCGFTDIFVVRANADTHFYDVMFT